MRNIMINKVFTWIRRKLGIRTKEERAAIKALTRAMVLGMIVNDLCKAFEEAGKKPVFFEANEDGSFKELKADKDIPRA